MDFANHCRSVDRYSKSTYNGAVLIDLIGNRKAETNHCQRISLAIFCFFFYLLHNLCILVFNFGRLVNTSGTIASFLTTLPVDNDLNAVYYSQ